MKESALLQFLARRFARHDDATLGIGDDCCEWDATGRCALSVDSLVEGRHFTATDDPALIGKKAAAAALSDLAAQGAVPQGAAVALHCPSRWHAQRRNSFYLRPIGHRSKQWRARDWYQSSNRVSDA